MLCRHSTRSGPDRVADSPLVACAPKAGLSAEADEPYLIMFHFGASCIGCPSSVSAASTAEVGVVTRNSQLVVPSSSGSTVLKRKRRPSQAALQNDRARVARSSVFRCCPSNTAQPSTDPPLFRKATVIRASFSNRSVERHFPKACSRSSVCVTGPACVAPVVVAKQSTTIPIDRNGKQLGICIGTSVGLRRATLAFGRLETARPRGPTGFCSRRRRVRS